MNMITGYIGATSGEIIIHGHDINKEPEQAKKCMGYLPELPPVYGDMKVLEYLKFVAELKNLNPHTRTADIRQVMDLTGLNPVQGRLIRNLSKGYRQRVGLAQALMGLPEIIILDEPTVGLDPKQIIEIRNLIRSLKEKHTVILSTHILQEVSAVCDHVFIISKGKLVASDSMEHLEEKMSGAQHLRRALRRFKLKKAGLGVRGHRAAEIEQLLRVPVHGGDDRFVPCSMSRELYASCSSPARLEIFEGAGHGLSYIVDEERYSLCAAQFVHDCLERLGVHSAV